MVLEKFSFYLIKKQLYLLPVCIFAFCFIYPSISFADKCQNGFLDPVSQFSLDLQRGQYDESNHFVITRPVVNLKAEAPFLGRILKKEEEDILVIETVYPPSGKFEESRYRLRARLKTDSPHFFIINIFDPVARGRSDQLKLIYEALNSNREKVSSEELIPTTVREEEKLREEGFEPFYIRGLDEVHRNIALARQLRRLGVNPYSTHIKPFAELALSHIEFMRRGVDISTKEGAEQKKALETLRARARRAIKKETVTYRWWLRFNYALSSVLSEERGKLNRHQLEYIDRFVPHFPANILMPTPTGIMGIKALNAGSSEGVLAVGLVNEKTRIHNDSVDPVDVFKHDLEHSAVLIALNNMDAGVTQKQFYDKLKAEIEGRSIKEKKDIELMHFVLTREFNLHPIADFTSRPDMVHMTEALFRMDLKDARLSPHFGATIGIVDNYLDASSRVNRYFGL